jgi:hypothetical protein
MIGQGMDRVVLASCFQVTSGSSFTSLCTSATVSRVLPGFQVLKARSATQGKSAHLACRRPWGSIPLPELHLQTSKYPEDLVIGMAMLASGFLSRNKGLEKHNQPDSLTSL